VLKAAWRLAKDSVLAFLADGALSRGAAIAYYTVTSLAPVLLIMVAIAGLAFGEAAAQGAIQSKVSGLMGPQSADVLTSLIRSAGNHASGVIASVVGAVALLVTASGVFGEMQSALNAMWQAQPQGSTIGRQIRTRLISLALVAGLGLLLLASLLASAGLTAVGRILGPALPFGVTLLHVANVVMSLLLTAGMFAAIYKVLPDRDLTWRDVAIGAGVTAALFTIGKTLIGFYLGSSSMASSYGAAGGLLILLVWIYYSAQIFLLGAEFTKVYASAYGSLRGTAVAASVAAAAGEELPGAADPAPPETAARTGRPAAPPPGRRSPPAAGFALLAGAFLAGALLRPSGHRHRS